MTIVFITGTSRGLGKAIAEALISEPNVTVYGIGRSNTIVHKQYHYLQLDLSDNIGVSDFRFPEIADAEKIVLVNNAGILGEIKPIGQLSSQTIIDAFQVNNVSPALLMNQFINQYQSVAAEKMIINVGTGASQTAYDSWSNYCASKAALEMLTKVVHEEQLLSKQPYPFKAYSIAPGVVDTDMQQQIRSVATDDFSRKQKFVDLKTGNHLYTATDVAKEYVKYIMDPSLLTQVTHRVQL